ncbi:MAG: hypothetical protein WD060_09105 [Pirellulales bacterium]
MSEGVSGCGMPAGRGIALLADIPDGERRDGRPQRVVRRKHSVIAMPVLARLRYQIRKLVQKLNRQKLDDAFRPRLRGLPLAAPADPGGGLVSREHVADVGDTAVWAAAHGKSLER